MKDNLIARQLRRLGLAYEIQKLREGYYVLMKIKGMPELPRELERNFKIADEIMRYLVVRIGE